MKKQILIIPRNDGIAISMGDGEVRIAEMSAQQMLTMALRCQQVGLEMLRDERKERTIARKGNGLVFLRHGLQCVSKVIQGSFNVVDSWRMSCSPLP